MAVIALFLWVFEQPRQTKYHSVEPIDADDGAEEEEKQTTGSKRVHPPRTRKQIATLIGFAALSFLLGWLTYQEILFAVESWRWRHNPFILMKIVVRVFMLLLLTAGAAIVPLAFVVRRAQALVSK